MIKSIECISRKVSIEQINYMDLYADLWSIIYKDGFGDVLIARV